MPGGAGSASPQRRHEGGAWRGNSVQQTSQIGARESRGRSEPQREQEVGKRVQLKLSRGLRSTRTTARQRVVCDGGTSLTALRESLWKTHLAVAQRQFELPDSVSIAQSQFRAPARDLGAKFLGKEKSSETRATPFAAPGWKFQLLDAPHRFGAGVHVERWVAADPRSLAISACARVAALPRGRLRVRAPVRVHARRRFGYRDARCRWRFARRP